MSSNLSTLFASVKMATRDPILGLTEAFNVDPRENKVNLGVGMAFDDDGKIMLLSAVKTAEKMRLEAMPTRGYQPIEGPTSYNQAVQKLLFGSDSKLLTDNRILTFETLGGTGALKVGADYLKRLLPNSSVYISDPSWENHRALFESAGFPVETYPYYDPLTRGVNFSALISKLNELPTNSIIIMHACCHNPTGADLDETQWRELIAIFIKRQLIPFIDMAYQGFAESPESDAIALRLFSKSGLSFFVSSSFSKSFSLYGERVGALSIVTANKDESMRVLSQVKSIIRTNYSNPPTHGGAIVATVLSDPALTEIWVNELAGMRDRIRTMRTTLVTKLCERGVKQDFSFISHQRGMFSYTGLSVEQVERLKNEFAIYAVSTGRICLAALNSHNINYVADSIATILES